MQSQELGRLNKRDAGDLLARRKVYIALLVPLSPGAPDGFDERFGAYWKSVDRNVAQLEARAGTVKRVFVEGVSRGGQAGLNMLEKSNPAAHELVTTRLKSGAVIEGFEDESLFAEVLDWGRCLQAGFVSRKVGETVNNAFRAASAARLKHLQTRLNDGVKQMEAALLLTSRADSISPPPDMERFLVSPPELDELERWVREANEAILKAVEEEEARLMQEEQGHAGHGHGPPSAPGGPGPARPQQASTPPPPSKPGGTGLWTPGQR